MSSTPRRESPPRVSSPTRYFTVYFYTILYTATYYTTQLRVHASTSMIRQCALSLGRQRWRAASGLASRDTSPLLCSKAPLGVRSTVCTHHAPMVHRWLSTAHPSSHSTAHSIAHSVTRAGCCCCGGGGCAGRRGALDTSETVVYLVRVRVGSVVGLGLGMLP